MIQPMSVAKWITSPRVGLVADLRAIETRNPPWTDDALRPAGRPGRVREQVRRLGIDLGRWQDAGLLGEQLVPWRQDDVLERGRLAPTLFQDREHGHLSAAPQRAPRRDRDLGSEARSRARQAGAAKPEKIGTWTAPRCAHACEATATSCDMGEERDTVTNADAERRESLCEARDLIRHLGERQCASPVVLAERDACDRVGRRLRPAMGAVVGNAHLSPDEPGRPFGAPRKVDDAVPRARELQPDVVDPRPRTSRDRPANGRRARGGRRCRAGASGGRRSRARALRERAPDDLSHGGEA